MRRGLNDPGSIASALAATRFLAGSLLALCFSSAQVLAAAALPSEPISVVQKLPAPSPHWMWVNDFVFPHMTDGQAILVDGDSGTFLGLLSTGFGFTRLNLPRDGSIIYSPESYFSRGTRGDRTDVVTLYDPRTLTVSGEIPIPPKRASNMPMMSNSELTDDDRFLLIYNFNPAQSVSVVDTKSRKFVGEIETAGCALVYVTGPRSFFSVCADGSLLDVRLNDEGKLANQQRTARMFDVARDPVTEKAVRAGDTWYFVSFGGTMYPVTSGATGLKAGETWSLVSAAERQQQWRPGGLQQLAVHPSLKRLYSIMHQGPVETHKDPGKEVWVYDLARKTRVQKIAMKNLSGSIQVTRDAKPLLFSIFIDSQTTDVYDALSGSPLRSIEHIGTTPTIMVNP
jgi:methylamine dehydrogenase heavy chain